MEARARSIPSDDPKRPAIGPSRTTRPPTAPTPSRPTPLTSRTTGSTISKPPTRPPPPSARRPASKREDGQREENQRPAARMSTVGSLASRTARPDVHSDRSRRTTVGGVATSPVSKTSSAVTRGPAANPTRSRHPANAVPTPRSIKSPSGESTKSLGSAIQTTTSETIPEEPDTSVHAPMSTFKFPAAAIPPKLEIRSMPTPKPHATSDAEYEKLPKPLARHARAQSAIIPRPSPAPVQPASEQEDTGRDMQTVQSLLHERNARQALAGEVKELKAELSRLEAANQRISSDVDEMERLRTALAAAEASHNKLRDDLEAERVAAKERLAQLSDELELANKVRQTSGGEDAVAREAEEKLRRHHAAELEQTRSAHQRDVAAIQATHDTEIAKLRKEVETQQNRTSRLQGVETKIEAVEEALRVTKTRATQNEQELQQTIQEKEDDRDKLARVVQELKAEIDRCQDSLNEDVAKQVKARKEAQEVTEHLRKELDEEKRRSREAAESVLKDREEQTARLDKTFKEAREKVEAEMERLKRAAADAQAAGKRLQEELNAVREQDGEQFVQNQQALDESAKTVQSLREELERVKLDQVGRQREATKEVEGVVAELREELKTMSHLREKDQHENDQANTKSHAVTVELQKQVENLRQDVDERRAVVEYHQNELKDLHQVKADAEVSHEMEMSRVKKVIEKLQDENKKMSHVHSDALVRKEEEARGLKVVAEDLQSQTINLQQLLEDVKQSKDGAIKEHTETIALKQREVSALQQQVKEESLAKELGLSEQLNVIEELQSRLREQQQTIQDAKLSAELQSGKHNQAVEGLQNEIQALQHKAHDEATNRERGEARLRDLERKHAELMEQHADALSKQQMHEDAQIRTEELESAVAEARAAKSNAEESLAGMRDEIKMLQQVLSTFEKDSAEKDSAEKDADHAKALKKQKREAEEQHQRELQKLKIEATETAALAEKELERKHDVVLAEKAAVDRKLREATTQSSRELEEERQKHEAAYRDLQNASAQVKEMHAKVLNETSREHRQELESLREIAKKTQADKAQSERDHAVAIESLAAKHTSTMQAVLEKHAAQIAKVEEETSRRIDSLGESRDCEREAAAATIERQATESLGKATRSQDQVVRDPETDPETPSKTGGLYHVFVNRNVADESNEADTPRSRLAETPLAYESENERYSPTPFYPRFGDREESEPLGVADVARGHGGQVATENARLRAEVEDLREKLAETQALHASPHPSFTTARTSEVEDPYAPRIGPTGHVSSANVELPGISPDDELTLEGTLASLQVQAGQLLEMNDDFMAERKRWSKRLSETRSDRSSPRQYGGSPTAGATSVS